MAKTKRPNTPKAVGSEWAARLRLLPGYDPFASPGDSWFDASEAEAAIAFIHDCIKHVEGALAGQPFHLEPWQQAIVANIFGWRRNDSLGREVRRYKEVFLYVPRKNGKTPLSAAIALYVFFCDEEAGQQDYIAAADREQAGMLFRQAKGMVEREPALANCCRIYGGNAAAGQSRSIVREVDGSFLRVVSADADSKHGGTSHLVIVDELHTQPNRDLVDVLTTSTASLNRKQTLSIYITTADYARPSICNEKYLQATKVRDGIIDDPSFLPAIYEAPKDADYTDPDVWAKANPNLDVSVSREYLEKESKKAQETPAYLNTFLRLHLNIQTDSATAAIDMLRWDACGRLPFNPADLAGLPCYGGLDLSTTTDLAALALLFALDGGFAALVKCWAPKARARHRSKTDRVPYEAWARDGWLKLTEGDVIDYDVIRQDINELGKVYEIREIAADRWNATQVITQLMGDGFTIKAFGQGYVSMTSPTKELLKLVASCKLAHGGNPLVRWCASNLMTESDAAGNLKPSKAKSTDRIDPLVALIMSLGVALVAPAPATGGCDFW